MWQDRDAVHGGEWMMTAIDLGNADCFFAKQVDHPSYETRMQERNVARREKDRSGLILQSAQSSRQALQRASAFLPISNDPYAGRKKWNVLILSRYNDEWIDCICENSTDAGQHELVSKRKPRFWLSHSTALAATEDDAADLHALETPACSFDCSVRFSAGRGSCHDCFKFFEIQLLDRRRIWSHFHFGERYGQEIFRVNGLETAERRD